MEFFDVTFVGIGDPSKAIKTDNDFNMTMNDQIIVFISSGHV
jgi:hypothetical protein